MEIIRTDMKKVFYSIISAVLLLGVTSCQPEDLTPETSAAPITSVTATVMINGNAVDFTAYPVEGSEYITVELPWYYPVESDNLMPLSVLENAKMTAVLANNVVIKEPLLRMDLTQENRITVVDQAKKEHTYIITGKIVKLSDCEILDFSIPALNLAGIVKPAQQTVSVLAVDELPLTLAAVTLSPHATISPDPRVEELDYNKELEFTVTAHNGKSKKTYKVNKEIPPKRENGMRIGSEKIIFEKQFVADLGLTTADMTTGLAVCGDYLIINTRAEDPMVLNRFSGEKVGSMAIDAIKGTTTNFYMTSDDEGNILFCNLTPNDGTTFKIWTATGINETPSLYIEHDASYVDDQGATQGNAHGRKISIQGSLNSDAIITAPFYGPNNTQFLRWVVKGGQLVSAEPETIVIQGLATGWTTNCDICYVDPSETSDYFAHYYSGNSLSWITGATNTKKAGLNVMSVNYIPNAVDILKFNGGTYLATNQANSFSWGGADFIWLLDVSTTDNFSGGLDADYNGDSKPKSNAVLWQSYHTYGPRAIPGAPINANGNSDVCLAPSADGYYMYLYFMFCNGYVVGVQFDCLDM